VDTATAKYLNDNVGAVLAKALAEMAVAQPLDGVDFLAGWLKTYAEQEEAKAAREREGKVLEEERAKTKAKLDEREAMKQKVLAEAKMKDDKYQSMYDKLMSPDTTFDDTFWGELVDVASTLTGAKAVYLGIQEEEGLDGVEGPCIAYTHTTSGSEFMIDQILPKEVGVTWGALIQNPEEEVVKEKFLYSPPVAEAPVVEVADGEDPPPPPPKEPYFPVSVSCVTDVSQVHYFDMTRLGAYLAVPLVYPSYYTADALAEAKAFESEKKAAEDARVAAQAQVDEATEKGEEPPEEAAALLATEPEVKELVMKGTKDVKMVLCIDTLGTNKSIEESKIVQALELCKAVGQCKALTETRQVDAQALVSIDEQKIEEIAEAVAQARTTADEELKEALDKEEAEAEEEKKEVVRKKYAFLKARQVLVAMKSLVMELKSWVVASPEIMGSFAATMLILGYTKEEVYPKRKSVLQWKKLESLLNDELFSKIEVADVGGERTGLTPEQKFNNIKNLAIPNGEWNEEAAKAVSPALELLVAFIQGAVAYRGADLEYRKAAYLKAKEEEGEAFAGPPLEALDDDFVE